MSIALLAIGRISVKTIIFLHPVVLVMASRMAKSSASVDVALTEGGSCHDFLMIFSEMM